MLFETTIPPSLLARPNGRRVDSVANKSKPSLRADCLEAFPGGRGLFAAAWSPARGRWPASTELPVGAARSQARSGTPEYD